MVFYCISGSYNLTLSYHKTVVFVFNLYVTKRNENGTSMTYTVKGRVTESSIRSFLRKVGHKLEMLLFQPVV